MKYPTHLLAILLSFAVTTSGLAQASSTTPQTSEAKAQARLLIEGLELHALREDTASSHLGVYPSYEEAQQLEAEIVQMYREIRASELSLIQRQTMERSLEATLTPLSERAKVDQALLTDAAKDAESVKEYQAELSLVLRETDTIVANARELLASFEVPPKPEPIPEERFAELTPEQIAEMATQLENTPEMPASELQSELSQQQLEAMQQQQAELQEQVEQDLADVELNLEEALQEIEAAKELVTAEIEKTDKAIENLEAELADVQKERKAVLEDLDEKIDVAEKIVRQVVEDLKTMQEVPKAQTAKAEKAVEDLREAMAAVLAADTAVPELEQETTKLHTQQAVVEVQAAQEAMQAAADGMAAMEAMAQMLELMEAGQALSEDMEIAQQQSLGVFASALSGKWLDITDQMRGRNLNQKPVEVPPAERPDLWEGLKQLNVAPSARKVITSGERGGDWIFVGDWYVLSRYDNARRANRQKVYPPESILDLDARYLSEDGQPMRWEYASFLPPTVRPYGGEPWKIYYFYTEMHFEEATEAWLAIGSDDRSDVWINDLPIWHSSNEHKNWNPAEGFRKVYFKQGRNKVLVRLENGHQRLGFSLYMRLDR